MVFVFFVGRMRECIIGFMFFLSLWGFLIVVKEVREIVNIVINVVVVNICFYIMEVEGVYLV